MQAILAYGLQAFYSQQESSMGTLHVAFQVVKVVEGHSAPLMQSVAAPTACRPSCHDIAAWEGMGLGNHNRHG